MNDIDIVFVFVVVTFAPCYGPAVLVIYRCQCKKFSFECFLISRPQLKWDIQDGVCFRFIQMQTRDDMNVTVLWESVITENLGKMQFQLLKMF